MQTLREKNIETVGYNIPDFKSFKFSPVSHIQNIFSLIYTSYKMKMLQDKVQITITISNKEIDT